MDLPQIRGDRVALLHVLDNLIDNAIKYSPDRRSLALRAESQGREVRLEVCDQGQGIPEHEIDRVFDKFYRGRNASGAGSGLGLTIVRRIVTDHGGRTEIRSRPGQGTCLTLVLPVESA